MILVRFLKVSGPYQPGECAGFGEAEAEGLIARGAAMREAEPVIAAEPPPAPTSIEPPPAPPAPVKRRGR